MIENDKKKDATRISRRGFLQGIGAGTIATLAARPAYLRGMVLAGATSAKDRSCVQIGRSRIPILRKSDVIILGGSVAAVAAALQFAHNGLKVVMVEHRNYLGREISATLKPWIDLGKLTGQVPEPFAACLKKMDVPARPGEMPIGIDAFKLSQESLLLDAGVDLIYSSLPTEAIVVDGALRGVAIGNKSGRQALLGHQVLDATSTALVARISGAQFEPETDNDFHFVRMMEMEDVEALPQTGLTVPTDLGIAGNKLTIHPGYGFKGHVLIECPMELKLGKMNLGGMMQREIEARHRTMRLASYLIHNVSAFQAAKLAICSYELDGPQTTQLAGPSPAWAAEFKGTGLELNDKNQDKVQLSLGSFAGPIKNLWCINEAARLQGSNRNLLRDPVDAALTGAAFAQALLPKISKDEIVASSKDYTIPNRPPHELEVKHQDSPQRGRLYEMLIVPSVEVPIFREADVLVVGAGTSGATCANSAGREGAKTVVLELNPGLGGTATLGGVCAYWYGRYWSGFAIRNSNLVDEVHKSINWPTSANKLNGRWNIEAKMYALLKDAQRAGVDVFFGATTYATILRDNEVRGVVSATPYGPVAVLAKITIDATGDGDVAAFAGARFTFGAVRDHYPMWYNLAEYTTPTESRWHFAHTVDVTNVEDLTQAILIIRRGGPKCFDHGNYVATRESRHIIGDTIVTLTDMLRHTPFPDVINLGAGQMDCHRRIASDWLRAGLLVPILPTEMPYRAVLPQGLENILVVGKAVSLTHDAMYNNRNQPELENLGGAVGVAAAYAVRTSVSPRKVDLPKVQQRLTEVGTLLPDMLTRNTDVEPYDEDALRNLVRQIDGRHFAAWFNAPMAKEGTPRFREKIPVVEVCSSDPRLAVPILEQEYSKAGGDRQLRLAQALAMFGSQVGVPVLIAAIERGLANRITEIPMNNAPEAGSIEGQEWGIPFPPADLVYSLGMTRDPRATAVWDKVADATNPEPADFTDELPWPYHYVDSICYGAELLGDPAAVPILKKLHTRPTLRNQSVKEGFVVDFNLDKRALVEVTIGRGLASLGDAEGYEILIDYLNDIRANQAEFAHMTLQQLTGIDNGKRPKAWSQWLAGAKDTLKPIPLLDRGEGPDVAGPYREQIISLETIREQQPGQSPEHC
jgi:ribulose 1,5-bisphosphate synthetase/thiazole synthase